MVGEMACEPDPPASVLVSFDIDGTLEDGDPPGPLEMALVRRAQALGYLIGSASDRTIREQSRMWAKREITPDFVGHGALEHRVELLHQRIGRTNVTRSARPQVRLRLRHIAHCAIGHRQREMNDHRFRIEHQRLLEIIGGAPVLLLGQGRPAQSKQHRHRAGRERVGGHEQRLGVGRAPLIQIRGAEPEERWQIIGLGLERTLE